MYCSHLLDLPVVLIALDPVPGDHQHLESGAVEVGHNVVHLGAVAVAVAVAGSRKQEAGAGGQSPAPAYSPTCQQSNQSSCTSVE